MIFEDFFHGIHRYPPFRWQVQLAEALASGVESVDAPTASGKTAIIDAWIWALAMGRNVPRRLWYVVQRRILVDAAYDRALQIQERMPASILDRLLSQSATETPLQVMRLRGGVFEDTSSWDPSAATIVCSTADQHASRLLFRGYGVAQGSLPVHAALAGCNALVAVDESHLVPVYLNTLKQCIDYGADIHLLTLSATHGEPADIGVEEKDARKDTVLWQRIGKAKPAKLIKGGPSTLANEATAMVKRGRRAVVVFCNTVAVAIDVASRLPGSHLVTGRMREYDRQRMVQLLGQLRSNGPGPDEPTVVVATQTLEVGADLDFDGLVTQAASLSSLRQRFGRLDRLGNRDKVEAVIARVGKDPVYGELSARVWDYLKSIGDVVDMCTARITEMLNQYPPEQPLDASSTCGPRITLDLVQTWAQTRPFPLWDPAVGPFISPDPDISVSVVWREDLRGDSREWPDMVETCPPLSIETSPVPISALRKWAGKTRLGVRYRGPETALSCAASDLKPGDVWILPVGVDDGRQELGCTLDDSPADVADNEQRQRVFDQDILEALECLPLREVLGRINLEDWERVDVIQRPHGVLLSRRAAATSLSAKRPVGLLAHSRSVADMANVIAKKLGAVEVEDVRAAGMLHDVGKADPRMQLWMAAGDELLAKSGHTPPQIKRLRPDGLPPFWRHEALSWRLASKWPQLTQHLVATHHGWFRPGIEESANDGRAELNIDGETLRCDSTTLHDLQAESVSRWSTLLRDYGPWRLCERESVLVMADRIVSGREQAESQPQVTEVKLSSAPLAKVTAVTDKTHCPALRGDSLLGWLSGNRSTKRAI